MGPNNTEGSIGARRGQLSMSQYVTCVYTPSSRYRHGLQTL